MNVLIADLLAAAAPVMASVMNDLPESARNAVAQAYENDAWPELRIGVLNQAATVRLVMVNAAGESVQLAIYDHKPT